MSRLYLHKNDLSKNDKLPYFTLKLVPSEDDKDADWIELGAFWKSKNGIGYSGVLNDGIKVDTTNYVPRKKSENKTNEPTD